MSDLPVTKLNIHPCDKVQLLAERTMARKRIEQLEAENARLRGVLSCTCANCKWWTENSHNPPWGFCRPPGEGTRQPFRDAYCPRWESCCE